MIKNKKHLIPILSLALVVMLGATGVAAAAGVGVTAFASVLYHAVSGGPKPTSTLKAGDTQATTATGKRTESGENESGDALGETDETKTGATAATTAGTNANGTPIDAAASASLQALGGAAAGSTGTGTGTGAATLPGQTAIDATASASVTAPTAAGNTGISPGAALVVTKPGQPAVDVTAAASLKVAVSTSGATAGAGTGTGATQPPVDATAAASLPKPGSTGTGTGTTTTPATGTPTTQNAQLISKADAQKIAIATIGSTARVEEIELKSEHYPPVYEVKLIYGKAEYMVVIHAVTGAVISVGKDD